MLFSALDLAMHEYIPFTVYLVRHATGEHMSHKHIHHDSFPIELEEESISRAMPIPWARDGTLKLLNAIRRSFNLVRSTL